MSITTGDTVAFVDAEGVTWFGIAQGEVQSASPWPVIKVQIGGRSKHVPARDVVAWPSPDAVTDQRKRSARRRSPEVRSQPARGRAPGLDLGDKVVTTEAIGRRWSRTRAGALGLIIGRVGPTQFVVQFTNGRTGTAFAHQLTAFSPPVPATTPPRQPRIPDSRSEMPTQPRQGSTTRPAYGG